MQVNIPGSIIDPSYRYTRDLIKISIFHSNGGMTKLENINLIVEQLGCELDEILKFIKKHISCSIINKNGIFIKKIESADNLEEIIEEYIEKEILCKKCNNPEFNIDIQKKKKYKICKACGAHRIATI